MAICNFLKFQFRSQFKFHSGIGKTNRRRKRRNRKKKNDAVASSKDTIKTYNNSGVSWSDLNPDVLLLVMMRLGIVDFFAFSGVCKSWRSVAVSDKNKFIVSRKPMSIHVSDDVNEEEECHFKDFEGRKFKPIIPHYAGRVCIGVTCGYLILLGEKNNDFWLVNLITRDELYFPNVPDELFCCYGDVKAILVFSQSKCGWVFIVLNLCTDKIWFSVEGKQEWMKISTGYSCSISDLHSFKGKIYAIEYDSHKVWLFEIKLYPEPKLVLLKMESIPEPHVICPLFVSFGENLYVIDQHSKHPYKNIQELDLGKMKLVSLEKKGKEYAFFLSKLRNHGHANILPESWVDLRSQYGRDVVTCKPREHKVFRAQIWYFFHDCFNVDHIHE